MMGNRFIMKQLYPHRVRLVNETKALWSLLWGNQYSHSVREFLKPYYWKPVFWKRGYGFVSAGGASLDVLKKYIENQGYID